MRKYIKGGVCLLYSTIKFMIIKLIYFKRTDISYYNFFSPFTTIELDKQSSVKISRNVRMRSGGKLLIRKDGDLKIGSSTFFNYNCIVTCHEKVVIGNNVQIGPNVLIYDHDHDFHAENGMASAKFKTSPVEIGDNVWIGANVIILRGSVIGDNCVVGAGTIVKGCFNKNMLITNQRKINSDRYE